MAKIVIDARIIKSSTGRYVERLLYYLQQIDQTNHYIVLVPSKDLDYFQPTNPNFTVQACDFANYSLAEQWQFKKLLDQLQADLVHFCMPQQPVLYRGKTVTTFHDLTLLKVYNRDKNWLIFKIKQGIGKWLFRRVAHKTNHIITPSQFTKQDLIDTYHINPDKISVTYESADFDQVTAEPYPTPFRQFIMYVGQQSTYKNIARLGDAHQKLLEHYPDSGLLLVGSLNQAAKLNQAYFEQHNYRNIQFTGFVSDQQLAWLYQHCSAYIFPSFYEGFGLPGVEAMAAGAPLISSNATCLPEIYADGALYFDPSDTNDLVDKISQVLSNQQLRQDLISRGKRRAHDFSWQTMAEQTLDIYQQVIQK